MLDVLIIAGIWAVLLSRPLMVAWVIRRESIAQGGSLKALQRTTRDTRRALVTLAVQTMGFVLLGVSLTAQMLGHWWPPLMTTAVVVLTFSLWPFRLLITRWIK